MAQLREGSIIRKTSGDEIIATINDIPSPITKADIIALGIPSTNTTYSEISEAEIDTGTASTRRTITARRVTFIINKIKGMLTKDDVGLANVDNTSDANKPISTATQTALNGKLNTNHVFTWGNLKGM